MALLLLAILVGIALPVQAGVNAQLRISLGHPLVAAFVSFLVGTLALGLLLVVLRIPLPGARTAAHALDSLTAAALTLSTDELAAIDHAAFPT